MVKWHMDFDFFLRCREWGGRLILPSWVRFEDGLDNRGASKELTPRGSGAVAGTGIVVGLFGMASFSSIVATCVYVGTTEEIYIYRGTIALRSRKITGNLYCKTWLVRLYCVGIISPAVDFESHTISLHQSIRNVVLSGSFFPLDYAHPRLFAIVFLFIRCSSGT